MREARAKKNAFSGGRAVQSDRGARLHPAALFARGRGDPLLHHGPAGSGAKFSKIMQNLAKFSKIMKNYAKSCKIYQNLEKLCKI